MGFARGCWYPLRERCRPEASRPGALAHRFQAEEAREIFTRIEASTIVGDFQGNTTRVAHEFQIRPARACLTVLWRASWTMPKRVSLVSIRHAPRYSEKIYFDVRTQEGKQLGRTIEDARREVPARILEGSLQ
jgi:hypothetical protein